jgi:hypothetical protein
MRINPLFIFIPIIAAIIVLLGLPLINSGPPHEGKLFRVVDSVGNSWEPCTFHSAGTRSMTFMKSDGNTVTLRGDFTYVQVERGSK